MILTLDELLKGKSTKIKNNNYFSTEQYVIPFIERLNNIATDYVCRAIEPIQLQLDENGEPVPIYNKVLIEGLVPYDEKYAIVYGMSYALDVKTPVCKFFTCFKDNLESGHLFIDNDRFITYQEINPETRLNYAKLDNILQMDTSYQAWTENLKQIDFNASNDEVNYRLGQWIRFAINFSKTTDFGEVKIATNDVIAAYKSLFENYKSEFFTSLGVHVDFYRIYSAFSKILYDGKDIVNLIDKTYLLKSILSL